MRRKNTGGIPEICVCASLRLRARSSLTVCVFDPETGWQLSLTAAWLNAEILPPCWTEGGGGLWHQLGLFYWHEYGFVKLFFLNKYLNSVMLWIWQQRGGGNKTTTTGCWRSTADSEKSVFLRAKIFFYFLSPAADIIFVHLNLPKLSHAYRRPQIPPDSIASLQKNKSIQPPPCYLCHFILNISVKKNILSSRCSSVKWSSLSSVGGYSAPVQVTKAQNKTAKCGRWGRSMPSFVCAA